MSITLQRHPFLDDLAEDVVLVSSILRGEVSGRPLVLATVKAGASLYLSQTPRFLGSMGLRSYFEYEVMLAGDQTALGLVSILRDTDAAVRELHIAFSPLGSVLALAEGVKARLSGQLDPELFL